MRQYRSRLSEVEEKKSIKTAFLFGGGTILILVAAILFGIPLFSKFTTLFVKTSATPSTQAKMVLPPNLDILPQYTNQATIIVKGTAGQNQTIKIFFNSSVDEVTSDGSGNFADNIGLTKGVNTIYAQAIDSDNNASANSVSYTVNYTVQVPNLTVSTPQNNQTFYGSSQQNITIQGSTDANNTVMINDHIAIVDTTGKFSLAYTLQNGDNNLKVISTDQAGNKKEIDLKLTYNP